MRYRLKVEVSEVGVMDHTSIIIITYWLHNVIPHNIEQQFRSWPIQCMGAPEAPEAGGFLCSSIPPPSPLLFPPFASSPLSQLAGPEQCPPWGMICKLSATSGCMAFR
jgi:hypothetical protein